MRRFLAFAVFLAVTHAAPAAGRIVQEVVPGSTLRYTLSLPAGDGVPRAAPLVVALHYGGPVGPWYGRGLLEEVVQPALRPLGAVMVAPDCAERAWLACGDDVEAVVAHVRESLGLADSCTVLAGYSKGGIGVWDLVSRARGAYSAAVVMAARAPEAAVLDGWSLPVRVLHGARDELFPVSPVRAAVVRLRESGVDADLTVVDGTSHYEMHRFVEPLAALVAWLGERCAERGAVGAGG